MDKKLNMQATGTTFCKKYLVLVSFALLQLFFSPLMSAKKAKCPPMGPRLTVEEYCEKYSKMAREQMRKHGVPASITLAQGILESGYGSSYLAVVANNHFGIKAYSRNWKGPTVLCDDDAPNEPFCKFGSVAEGFEYHSTFLKTNPRYAPLFKLDIRDYESWANGLKACGYATNPKYGSLLIGLIEANHLDVYDIPNSTKVTSAKRTLYVTSAKRGLKYVRCLKGDDLAAIAKAYRVNERTLRRWNDLTKRSVLKENDIIYLQAKRNKAPKEFTVHRVKAGESMWSISQLYGVTIKSLMRRNKLVSATVHEGQELRLR